MRMLYMGIRTLAPAVVLAFSGVAACSSQPAAPSSAASPSGATAVREPTTLSPTRFGDRTPGVVFVISQGL